jgi:hypothetical protein
MFDVTFLNAKKLCGFGLSYNLHFTRNCSEKFFFRKEIQTADTVSYLE